MKQIFVVTALIVTSTIHAIGQSTHDSSGRSGELFDTIARMDSLLSDRFNTHDAEALMKMFTVDLEFYHDGDGFNDFQKTKDDFKTMFGNATDIRRDLVPGSLEVYPLKDYGAIEIGQHRFCHKENAKEECGAFKFAMVWRKSDGLWRISRVLSYGH